MKYYQISYPRSGANWTRYIARHLLSVDDDIPVMSPGSGIYDKYHYLTQELKQAQKALEIGRALVLVIRDFRQCIFTHKNRRVPKGQDFAKYANPIITYDAWEGDKFLMRYEHLLTDHQEAIRQFALWMDRDPTWVLAHYTSLKQESLSAYKDSRTDGKQVSPAPMTADWHLKLPDFLTAEQIETYLDCYL